LSIDAGIILSQSGLIVQTSLQTRGMETVDDGGGMFFYADWDHAHVPRIVTARLSDR
jgi:hypothetical protein